LAAFESQPLKTVKTLFAMFGLITVPLLEMVFFRSLFKRITEFENTEPKGSLFIYQKRKRGKRTWTK